MGRNAESVGGVYDVAIMGGGLAGLTLARQLSLEMPELSVVVVDRLERPLPDAAFKVGESTVEVGAHYLGEVLQLREYMRERQLPKFGLRYFIGGGTGPVEDRAEFGLSRFAPVPSYQLDRGIFEEDLRAMVEEAGVELLEGWSVAEVTLGEGEAPHQVECRHAQSDESRTIRCRFVADATGRRRMLQRKLGLARKGGYGCSSVWLRYPGRIDINELVPATAESWFGRTEEDRFLSTNHLMGDGYWVWLIPLSSGNTSVGIVAREDVQPFETYRTRDRAEEWLRRHEPRLAAYLEGREPLDFLCMRDYAYASRRVFSEDRWSCVGEAGVFADPFYSPGTDFIGYSNSITVELIRADREGRLSEALADRYNAFFLALAHWITRNIQRGYGIMGRPTAMMAKIAWDTCAAWGLLAPQMFNGIFRDPPRWDRYRKSNTAAFEIGLVMQDFFEEWGKRTPGRVSVDFLDYLQVPLMYDLHVRNLRSGRTDAEILADQAVNAERFEELALAQFLVAVEDVLPEHFHRFSPDGWYNAWAISLDPERWEADGLFEPRTAPRDLRTVWESYRRWFRPAIDAGVAAATA